MTFKYFKMNRRVSKGEGAYPVPTTIGRPPNFLSVILGVPGVPAHLLSDPQHLKYSVYTTLYDEIKSFT